MSRHFYLRLPHNNYPVACVAVETQPTADNSILVTFAVATYNPADLGTIPFNKSKARNMAAGRLKSPRHSLNLIVPKDRPAREIGRLICTSIASGQWSELHPCAAAAKTAARAWLSKDIPIVEVRQVDPIVPAPSEPEHHIDAFHNEGNPNHSPEPEVQPTAETHSYSDNEGFEPLPQVIEVHISPYESLPSIEQAVETIVNNLVNAPECPECHIFGAHETNCSQRAEPVTFTSTPASDISDAGATAVEEQEFRQQIDDARFMDSLFGPIEA